MSLRVIAGTARGMRLKSVPGDSTRPIMDRVKEALFSILGREINNANFLDLFAGTGSVGIEALSRGAKHAVFIERDGKALKIIKENLGHTRLADKGTIIQRDAFQVMRAAPDRLFKYVYIAPPQYKGMWRDILQTLDQNSKWHHYDTIVIVQIDPKEYNDPQLAHLVEYDRRKYGRTLLLFYEFALDEDESGEEIEIE